MCCLSRVTVVNTCYCKTDWNNFLNTSRLFIKIGELLVYILKEKTVSWMQWNRFKSDEEFNGNPFKFLFRYYKASKLVGTRFISHLANRHPDNIYLAKGSSGNIFIIKQVVI